MQNGKCKMQNEFSQTACALRVPQRLPSSPSFLSLLPPSSFLLHPSSLIPHPFSLMLLRFTDFLRALVRSREVILTMTRRDFTSRYLGSYLGLAWAFIQPLTSILVVWFVFQVGFKAAPVYDFPFILWLAAGMIPWMFFSEC